MPKLIKANPYDRYKVRRVVLQTPLRAKVIVERRDLRAHRYIMVIAPTVLNGKENQVVEGVEKIMAISHPNLASVRNLLYKIVIFETLTNTPSSSNTTTTGLRRLPLGRILLLVNGQLVRRQQTGPRFRQHGGRRKGPRCPPLCVGHPLHARKRNLPRKPRLDGH